MERAKRVISYLELKQFHQAFRVYLESPAAKHGNLARLIEMSDVMAEKKYVGETRKA